MDPARPTGGVLFSATRLLHPNPQLSYCRRLPKIRESLLNSLYFMRFKRFPLRSYPACLLHRCYTEEVIDGLYEG